MIERDLKKLEKIKAKYHPARVGQGKGKAKDEAACIKVQSLLSAAQYHIGRLVTFKEDENVEVDETENVNETDGESTQQDGEDVQEGAGESVGSGNVAPSTDSDADTQHDDAEERSTSVPSEDRTHGGG